MACSRGGGASIGKANCMGFIEREGEGGRERGREEGREKLCTAMRGFNNQSKIINGRYGRTYI